MGNGIRFAGSAREVGLVHRSPVQTRTLTIRRTRLLLECTTRQLCGLALIFAASSLEYQAEETDRLHLLFHGRTVKAKRICQAGGESSHISGAGQRHAPGIVILPPKDVRRS